MPGSPLAVPSQSIALHKNYRYLAKINSKLVRDDPKSEGLVRVKNTTITHLYIRRSSCCFQKVRE